MDGHGRPKRRVAIIGLEGDKAFDKVGNRMETRDGTNSNYITSMQTGNIINMGLKGESTIKYDSQTSTLWGRMNG